jgi:hypothetical protein
MKKRAQTERQPESTVPSSKRALTIAPPAPDAADDLKGGPPEREFGAPPLPGPDPHVMDAYRTWVVAGDSRGLGLDRSGIRLIDEDE